MASTDNPISNWRSRVLPALLAAALVACLLWVWAAARGSTDGFPSVLIQAEGLLLTALVFVMGFGQSNLRRAADAAISDVTRWTESLRAVYERPGAMSTMDLFAACQAAKHAAVSVSVMLNDVQRDSSKGRRYRRFAIEPSPGGIGDALLVGVIDRELARGASKWRRRFLERERARIKGERAQRFEDAKDLGRLGDARLKGIGGSFAVQLSLALQQLRAVGVFAVVMVALTVAGFFYAGGSFVQAPAPELWATLAILALALTYAWILRRDARIETTRVEHAIETSWPCVLWTAEFALASVGREDEDDRETTDRVLTFVDQAVAPLQDSLGDFGWYLSVRARHAAFAPFRQLAAHPDLPLWERDRRILARARRYARAAAERTDDPVAAVTLAALLGIDEFGNPRTNERAGALVDRAVALLTEDEAPSPSERFLDDGYGLAALALSAQARAYPLPDHLRQRLQSALEDDHPDPAKPAWLEQTTVDEERHEALLAESAEALDAWSDD